MVGASSCDRVIWLAHVAPTTGALLFGAQSDELLVDGLEPSIVACRVCCRLLRGILLLSSILVIDTCHLVSSELEAWLPILDIECSQGVSLVALSTRAVEVVQAINLVGGCHDLRVDHRVVLCLCKSL